MNSAGIGAKGIGHRRSVRRSTAWSRATVRLGFRSAQSTATGGTHQMAIDTTAPRSRRGLLTAGIGALGALVATAVARPDPGAADTDTSAGHKGGTNSTSAETRITSSGGIALKGVVSTSTANLAGVAGVSNSPHASGAF